MSMKVSMSTAAMIGARQQTQAIRRPRPLLAVMTWELRRFRASRLFWIQAFCFFALVLFVLWAKQMPEQYDFGPNLNGFVAGTSAWGLLDILPSGLVLLLGLLLPFVTADAVTRDLQRDTHELLMTTALPSWAYVWGRHLASLLMSLGLALLILAAILGMGLLLHLTIPGYPAPVIGNVLILWVGMVLSATVLLSSLGFALGTLFPRQSTLVKIGILMGWFVAALILPGVFAPRTSPPAWYVAWDPTSAATARELTLQYHPVFVQNQVVMVTSQAQLRHILLTLENRLPDLAGWFAPHLILAGLSLGLVLIAALAFKRSRDVLS